MQCDTTEEFNVHWKADVVVSLIWHTWHKTKKYKKKKLKQTNAIAHLVRSKSKLPCIISECCCTWAHVHRSRQKSAIMTVKMSVCGLYHNISQRVWTAGYSVCRQLVPTWRQVISNTITAVDQQIRNVFLRHLYVYQLISSFYSGLSNVTKLGCRLLKVWVSIYHSHDTCTNALRVGVIAAN